MSPNRTCLLAAATLSMVIFALPLSSTSAQQATPEEQAGITQRLGNRVPLHLTFVNEAGHPVQLSELVNNRPVLLNLVYYQCPQLCNMSMNGLVRSLRALQFTAGEEFTVITVSFDSRETPALAAAAKRTAMTRYGRDDAAENWHFLTGNEENIRKLADAVGFHFHWEPDRGQYVHAAGLMVLTPQGIISRYLMGIEYAPRDLRLSLVEAADGKIGSFSDAMLLLCYQYDPTRGKYGLIIDRFIKAVGVGFVLLMAIAIGLMIWRERRRKQEAATPVEPPPLAT